MLRLNLIAIHRNMNLCFCRHIFLFHITDQRDDRRIRELLHILNIDVIDSPLDPLSIPALENFCMGVRKVILDLDKAYELLALLKLEGY